MEKVIARAGQRGGAQAARAQRENQEAEHAPHTSLFSGRGRREVKDWVMQRPWW